MKKKAFSITVECITSNNNRIVKNLSEKLHCRIKDNWPDSVVVLLSHEDYWKTKKEKKIIFKILYIAPIKVKDLLNIFNLTWHFSEGLVTNIDSLETYMEESAVWSKQYSPDEMFLLSVVEWVHIYT